MASRFYIAKAYPFAPKAANAPKAAEPKVKSPGTKQPSSAQTKQPAAPKSKEAQVNQKGSGLPKPSAKAVEAGNKSAKQGKYGQPVQHVDKKRYPERPNNSLGETSSTWVIPAGQKPMYNKAGGEKQEEKPGQESSPQDVQSAKVKTPVVSTKDHGTVKPVDSKMMTPKVASQPLLKPAGKPSGTSKPNGDLPDNKEIMAQLKAGKRFEHPDGSKIYSKTNNENQTVQHVVVDAGGKKKVFYDDEELGEHLDKMRGGKGASVPSAQDHRQRAAAAREAGANDIAEKHEKLANAKEKMAEKEPKSNKKLPKSKDEKDLEIAEKEAGKFREKLIQRKKKNDDAEKKKLERQKKSSDEKVVNEARKQLKEKAEERKRVAKKPDSPEAHAAHQMHTSKAKESQKKIDDLLKDPETSDEDKKQLQALKSSLDVHARQKHEPNSDESKKLNGMAKVINHMHGNQQKKIKAAEGAQKKQAKLKVKDEVNQKKDAEKKLKDDQKAKEKAVKEAEKQRKEQEKAAAKNGQVVSQQIEEHQQQPTAAKKVGLGAFHSGRAAGEAASNNAAAESGAGLGHQVAGGAVSGVAHVGHKLLGGGSSSKEPRYTIRNKKEQVEQSGMQTVAKSLWHNDFVQPVEDESSQMLKSLTENFKKSFGLTTEHEAEFLAVECGYPMEKIQKGLVSVHGKHEGRYVEWLCKKANSVITDLRGSLESD